MRMAVEGDGDCHGTGQLVESVREAHATRGDGSGTDLVVDCHGQGWAETREREGCGTDLVVDCHDPGWVVAKGKEGPGTASC